MRIFIFGFDIVAGFSSSGLKEILEDIEIVQWVWTSLKSLLKSPTSLWSTDSDDKQPVKKMKKDSGKKRKKKKKRIQKLNKKLNRT